MAKSNVRSNSLYARAEEITKYLDESSGYGEGHDVSNEPRVPAGRGRQSGEWTSSPNGAQGEYTPGDPNKFLDIMEPAIRDLAKRLGIDESWLLGLSAYESAWLCQHDLELNNPFGVTHAGHDNVQYDSISQAVQSWAKQFGSTVNGATSAADFVGRLHDGKYNVKNVNWSTGVLNTIKSVDKRQRARWQTG